jgi:RNA recognition motif-containing protein
MDYSGRNKGIAKASFEFIHQAKSAMEAVNGQSVHGRPIRVVFSRIKPTRPVGKASNMLFIGGLPHDVAESEVRRGIAGFDGLQQIRISKNRHTCHGYEMQSELSVSIYLDRFQARFWKTCMGYSNVRDT